MKILTQEQYKEYRKKLAQEGFPVIESETVLADEKTFRILEERFVWEISKID